MRIVKINKYYKDPANSEEMVIELEPLEYQDDLELFEPQNKKQLAKYVIEMKYLMRKSYEYKRFIKFLKTDKNLSICGIHHNIRYDEGFSIEIHHTPFVAEDILYTVLNKRYQCGEELKMGMVIEEVMLLHWIGVIGLYPLCETCHSYAHSDDTDLFIPLENIYGDPNEFFNMYKIYMTDELKNKFETFKELNRGYSIISKNLPTGLIKKYIYINSEHNMISATKLAGFINETSK